MKRFLVIIILLSASFAIKAQSVEQSCQIIETEIADSIYRNFSVSSSGYLTFNWFGKDGSQTLLTVDLTKVTISKDVWAGGYRVFIRCIDDIDCINENGQVGSDENYFADFSKTYLPANDERGMNIIYSQLLFLLKYGNNLR
jgi:hypothetical protein